MGDSVKKMNEPRSLQWWAEYWIYRSSGYCRHLGTWEKNLPYCDAAWETERYWDDPDRWVDDPAPEEVLDKA
jgi:hypothetical protein